jgi:IS30 family transposase
MDRISDAERLRIAQLLAEGASAWRLHKEINRSRYAIRRAVVALHRPANGSRGGRR